VNLRSIFFYNQYRGWLCGNGGRIKYTRTSEEICLVTVDTLTNKNKIIWERILGQQTSYYKVYRYEVGSNYMVIGTVPFDDMSEFIDVTSSPETHSNRYKISAVDSLGIESDLSPYHETMNLQVSQGGIITTFVLAWNQYTDESGRFIPDGYEIFRGHTPDTLTSHITLPGINISYNDLNVTSTQYYLISVLKPTPCYPSSSAGTKEVGGPYSSSFSNMEENIVDFISEIFNVYGKIEIAPNPVKSSATISIQNLQVKGNCMMQIHDITGKLVRSEDLSNVLSNTGPGMAASFIIERGDLKSGVYFVEVSAENVYRGKLVVE